MDFKKLLENKILLASIVGGVVLLLIVFIICGTIAASSKSKNDQIDVSKEPLKEDVDLLTTDNLGKALEIQALLARNILLQPVPLMVLNLYFVLKKATVHLV